MEGQPVWLASLSMRDSDGNLVGTFDWHEQMADPWVWGYRMLADVLFGVGDPFRERLFRMNVTMCLHRAATASEVKRLPRTWHRDLSGMAGGPVEVLWSKGCVSSPSAMPCENPGRCNCVPGRPDLWIPEDCGKCGPCLARAMI